MVDKYVLCDLRTVSLVYWLKTYWPYFERELALDAVTFATDHVAYKLSLQKKLSVTLLHYQLKQERAQRLNSNKTFTSLIHFDMQYEYNDS